jgi:hypothetical protein
MKASAPLLSASQGINRSVSKLVLMVVLIFGLPRLVEARLTEPFSDQQVFGKADLVVIATALSTTDTDERTALSDVRPPINAIGVTSDFAVCVILKGVQGLKRFQLHHYRTDEEFTNGPELVEIPKDKHPTYLLFLIKESDGRYAPVTGQTDPSGSSVFLLRGSDGRAFKGSEPAAGCQEGESGAGGGPMWTYQTMVDKADLVATAGWVAAKDTDERSVLPRIAPSSGRVIGVQTEFKTSLVFKGPENLKQVTLHHYRLQNELEAASDGLPKLIRITSAKREPDGREYPGGGKFLLFLKRETDGRYAPVTDQTSPATYAVLQLLPAVRAD